MCSGQHRLRRSRKLGQSEDYVGITVPGTREGMGQKPGSVRRRGHPHRSPLRCFHPTFFAAALYTALASLFTQRAQAAPTNDTLQLFSSFQAFQCQNMSIAWQGGVPAYSLTVVSSGHVEEFAGIAGTSFPWLVDAPLGTPVFVSLFDSTGARTDSPVFDVISGPGSSDTCVPPTTVSSSSSSPGSGSSSSATVPAAPTTSVRETPSVLSFGTQASHLPPGALAAIVAEAAILMLSVVGLLIMFSLDRKDRARRGPTRASPPRVDLLESPRPHSLNPYLPSEPASRSTTAASASPQPAPKELPLRTGTVRRGPSPTVQQQNVAARQSFAPSEATFVGLSVSPAASTRGSPSSSVRFTLVPGAGADEIQKTQPRKKRRTPLHESTTSTLVPPSAFPAERVRSADLREVPGAGGGRGAQAVDGSDASTHSKGGQEQDAGGEPRLLMARFEA